MITHNVHDLDYLAARLHGRRSGMAEDERLDALCHIRTVNELARQLYPAGRIANSSELQQHMIAETLAELAEIAIAIGGPGGNLLQWLRVRYQIEALKVIIRGIVNRLPAKEVNAALIKLPPNLALPLEYQEPPPDRDTFELLAAFVPAGPLLNGVNAVERWFNAVPRPFILELALDHVYVCELQRLAQLLPAGDAAPLLPLINHEVNGFNMQLALRGTHHYRLDAAATDHLFIAGGYWRRESFNQLLQAEGEPAIVAAVRPMLAPCRQRPTRIDQLEKCYWGVYLQRANTLFRQRHMRLGAVVAFAALRRIELANLITLSEGLRLGLTAATLRDRLIPCRNTRGAENV